MQTRHTKYASIKLLGCCLYGWLVQQVSACSTDECLLWPFGKNEHGYGIVRRPGSPKHLKVHRVAYMLVHGVWPEPFGLHTCDTPACFNPRHIVPGNQYDNMRQCVQRGRLEPSGAKGELNSKSRLTVAKVKQIRSMRDSGMTCPYIASFFGVTPQTIWYVVRRITWKHV